MRDDIAFLLVSHLFDHIQYVFFIRRQILAAHKIDEPQRVFPAYHQILDFRVVVYSKRDYSNTRNRHFTLVIDVPLFPAIVAKLFAR